MFRNEFRARYTTIPFAIYKGCFDHKKEEIITHQHREIEIICMTEGEAIFFVDSQRYVIKKGEVLIISPYALHRTIIPTAELTSYYCICFDLDLICDQWLKSGLERQSVRGKILVQGEDGCQGLLQRYIEDAFLACERKETGWEMIAIGNMSLLLGLLKKNEFFSENAISEKNSNFGKNVMQYIISNYSANVTSRDAANELYINHSFFCRLFKKTFGCCFTDYILAYRIEKAKEYLANTDLPVTEIAFKVGFNDCSYFCKAFKKRAGVSPLCYRKSKD